MGRGGGARASAARTRALAARSSTDGAAAAERGAGNPWLRARRLLVVRADNIGDVLMAGPALEALRAALPAARITLLASPTGAEAAPLLPWIDDVIAWRVLWQDLGRLPLDPRRERRLIARLARERFDGAIILTSFSQSPHPPAFAAWLAGVPLRAGASHERSELLTHAIPSGPDGQHQVARNLELVAALGFPVHDDRLALHVPAAAQVRAAALLEARGVSAGTPYLLLAPWASAAARTYDAVRMAEAARLAAAATGATVVVTAHPRDAERTAALAARTGPRTVDLTGATSVAELAALIARARLVLTVNTSALHMADAFGVPVVALYSGTDLVSQWAPRRAPHALLRRATPCTPCYRFTCPFGMECLDVEPEAVAAAVTALLSKRAARTPSTDAAAERPAHA
ncbi:MAG TPA: glycosyltransferase family 9 protein [Gammaproteobacteria bacterium]